MDGRFYKKLYAIRIETTGEPPLKTLGQTLPEKYGTTGFDVTINGRTITVIPLPNQ
jgi:hypothetical protein